MNKIRESKILLELLSHPGEVLKEEIDERNMNQVELAKRCGLSEKHISSVINGKKAISVSFAKKLEYVLEIDSTFWLNLQMNYDNEVYDIKEKSEVCESEIAILDNNYFKKILSWLTSQEMVEKSSNRVSMILNLREFLNVGNLLNIESLNLEGAFRKQDGAPIDSYTLAAWIKACEIFTSDTKVHSELNIEKLTEIVPEMKEVMFERDPNEMIERLREIFASCGIKYTVIPHFTGAPIHGYIKRDGEALLMGSTIRGKYYDKFWFTIFHEIAHILNGDFKDNLVDFENKDSMKEDKADRYARDVLIDSGNYKDFVNEGHFSRKSVIAFSDRNKVLPGITVGRLQKEEYIGYDSLNDLRSKLEWKS